MFSWFNRYLPITIIAIFLVGCKMSSTSFLNKDDNNKVDFKISGNKKAGIKTNN